MGLVDDIRDTRREIEQTSDAIKEEIGDRNRLQNIAKRRRELLEELEKRMHVLKRRMKELEELAAQRPNRVDEIRLKLEEIRAERGDIHDRRVHLADTVLDRLRNWINDSTRRIQSLVARKHALRRRLENKRDRLEERREKPDGPAAGVVYFDGKPVAAWFVPWLNKIRARGRWKGYLVSGWRDPEYSEQLCINMCGAPSCPGRCAGRASNHSGSSYPAGAVDVSDYYNFAAEARAVGAPFFNALGAQDPVHFSTSGR